MKEYRIFRKTKIYYRNDLKTTRSSMSVNPRFLRFVVILFFLLKKVFLGVK